MGEAIEVLLVGVGAVLVGDMILVAVTVRVTVGSWA